MYTDDDFLTRRERVGDSLIRQNLGIGDNAMPTPRTDGTQMSTRKTWGLDGYPLASLFAPLQEWRNLYDYETALNKGTLFRELDLPFLGGAVSRGGNGRA